MALALLHNVLGKVCRTSGQALDFIGQKLEYFPTIEQLNPTVRAVKFNGVKPAIKGAFIASSASVVGKVTIGPRTSILYGAIVRGDVSTITIGESVTIGENTMIHCSSKPKEIPTVIGNNVVVGPSSILHGCVLEDGSQIGEGSQVMDGARIEKFAFVAPGSLVAQGKVVPTGQLWGGVPAKFQRNLTQEEITKMSAVVEENVTLSSIHAKEDIKTWKEIDEDNFYYDNIFDPYHPILREDFVFPVQEFNGHAYPGRILNTNLSDPDPYLHEEQAKK